VDTDSSAVQGRAVAVLASDASQQLAFNRSSKDADRKHVADVLENAHLVAPVLGVN
jgi:hypothetical protein